MDSISIDEKTGRISGTTKDTDQHITIGFLAIGNVTNPNGVTQVTGTYFQCGDGAGSMSISMLGGSAATVYDKANLTGMDVDANGNWSPGAGAAVTVTTGMTHITSNGEAPATDVSDSMSIKTGGTTKLLTSGLEQTNTDLATEISNMIFMQRGYQANTRIGTGEHEALTLLDPAETAGAQGPRPPPRAEGDICYDHAHETQSRKIPGQSPANRVH